MGPPTPAACVAPPRFRLLKLRGHSAKTACGLGITLSLSLFGTVPKAQQVPRRVVVHMSRPRRCRIARNMVLQLQRSTPPYHTHTDHRRPSVRVSYSSSLEHLPSTPGHSCWLSTSHVYLPTRAAHRSVLHGRAGNGVHGRRRLSSQAQGGSPGQSGRAFDRGGWPHRLLHINGVHGRRRPSSSQAQGGQPWAKQMGL